MMGKKGIGVVMVGDDDGELWGGVSGLFYIEMVVLVGWW